MESDFAASEDTAFVNDEISNIIKEAIGKLYFYLKLLL